jgi:hypothetical protein
MYDPSDPFSGDPINSKVAQKFTDAPNKNNIRLPDDFNPSICVIVNLEAQLE